MTSGGRRHLSVRLRKKRAKWRGREWLTPKMFRQAYIPMLQKWFMYESPWLLRLKANVAGST